MPNIYEYTDYRKYLKDYYNNAKSVNNNYSYQILSQKAGIKSKGFLHNVIKGTRNLSKSNIFGLSQAMKLSRHEADYFENLVAFNQASNLKEQNYYYERLTSIKMSGKNVWKPQEIRKDQFEFYSKLHYSTIRSLIDMYGFKDDYNWLAKNVYPKVTPGQAKKSVQLLEKLELIKKDKTGNYCVSSKSIESPKEVLSLALVNFHLESAKLAANAISELPISKRNISGMTMGIGEEAYKEICEEIRTFRKKIMQIAEKDQNASAVYQLNFQLFPVSNTNIERNKK